MLELLRLVRRGSTVLEAGANNGHYTALLAYLVGDRGKVIAVEPAPPAFEQLTQLVRARGIGDRVAVVPSALGDVPESAEILVPAGDTGQASLRRHRHGSWSRREHVVYPVSVVTADALLEKLGVGELGLCKLDVEGAELPLLKGAEASLRKSKPALILEVSRIWAAAFGYRPEDLLAYLEAQGYRRFEVVERRPRPLESSDIALLTDQSINILALATSR